MKHNFVEFDVEVNDIITPLSCSTMIVEFIKYIIYQKQLIPYQYDRLKMYVDKGKTQLDSVTNLQQDTHCRPMNTQQFLISDKYFKKISDAYNSLENIFNIIQEELTVTACNGIEEVVLLLGTSFLNPHDVFRICIPSLDHSHSEKYHSSRKNSRNLFRTIINSGKFYDLITSANCTTNLHVMLKMKADSVIDSKLIVQRSGYKIPSKGNQACITFKSSNVHPNCSCLKMKIQIFEDDKSDVEHHSSDYSNSSAGSASTSTAESTGSSWYQIKDTLKYFADVNINGISVPDIWMNPKLLHEHK